MVKLTAESTSDSFLLRAKEHWTQPRLDKINHGKRLLLTPLNSALLLRTIGLLNRDASMPADAVRKYLQVNHLMQQVIPAADEAAKRSGQRTCVVDLACGSSFLSFMLAWYWRHIEPREFLVLGIDHNTKLVSKCIGQANTLGLSEVLRFESRALDGGDLLPLFKTHFGQDVTPRVHLIVGLHACDTATDLVLSSVVASSSDAFVVAPCCQAELAKKWQELELPENHPHRVVFKTPLLRREVAASYTDTQRLLLMRANGYEVSVAEFTSPEHTPKNRMLFGYRRGRYLESAAAEYKNLVSAMGDAAITLADRLTSN